MIAMVNSQQAGFYSSTLLSASSKTGFDKYSPVRKSVSITGLALGIKPRFLATKTMHKNPSSKMT